jgi:hypothetical protein
MIRATSGEPQPRAEPRAYPAHTRARRSWWTRLDPPRRNGGREGSRAPLAGRARSAPSRVVVGEGGELTGSSRSAPLRGPRGPGAPGAHASCGCCSCGDESCGDRRDRHGGRVCARLCARVGAGGPAASDRWSIGRASPVAPLTVCNVHPRRRTVRRSPCRDDTPVSSLRDIVPLRSVTTSGDARTDRVRKIAERTGNGLRACCAPAPDSAFGARHAPSDPVVRITLRRGSWFT